MVIMYLKSSVTFSLQSKNCALSSTTLSVELLTGHRGGDYMLMDVTGSGSSHFNLAFFVSLEPSVLESLVRGPGVALGLSFFPLLAQGRRLGYPN